MNLAALRLRRETLRSQMAATRTALTTHASVVHSGVRSAALAFSIARLALGAVRFFLRPRRKKRAAS